MRFQLSFCGLMTDHSREQYQSFSAYIFYMWRGEIMSYLSAHCWNDCWLVLFSARVLMYVFECLWVCFHLLVYVGVPIYMHIIVYNIGDVCVLWYFVQYVDFLFKLCTRCTCDIICVYLRFLCFYCTCFCLFVG